MAEVEVHSKYGASKIDKQNNKDTWRKNTSKTRLSFS